MPNTIFARDLRHQMASVRKHEGTAVACTATRPLRVNSRTELLATDENDVALEETSDTEGENIREGI